MVALPGAFDRKWRVICVTAQGGEYSLSNLTEDEANAIFAKAIVRFEQVKLYCGDELVYSLPK